MGDPAHGYPFLATDVDLASAGYVEEEFHISGLATRYSVSGNSTATVLSTGHPYSTRDRRAPSRVRQGVQRRRDR